MHFAYCDEHFFFFTSILFYYTLKKYHLIEHLLRSELFTVVGKLPETYISIPTYTELYYVTRVQGILDKRMHISRYIMSEIIFSDRPAEKAIRLMNDNA